MNKILLSFLLILSFFLILSRNLIYSQSSGSSTLVPPIPGLTCGNAASEDPKNRSCCKKNTPNPDFLLDLLSWPSRIPFIGDTIGARLFDIRNSVLQLERDTNVIACPIGYPSDINNPNCTCLVSSQITPTPVASLKQLCSDYLTGSKEKDKCDECANSAGVWTSLGICAYGDFGIFIQKTVLGWGIGLAGIIALMCIIYGAFILQTSGGNPERVKKAQELLTSCIMGLMLIIFSVFILKLIGVDILKIPGLSK